MKPLKLLISASMLLASAGAALACAPGHNHNGVEWTYDNLFDEPYYICYSYGDCEPLSYDFDYYDTWNDDAYLYEYDDVEESIGISITPDDLCMYYGATDGFSFGEISGCVPTN